MRPWLVLSLIVVAFVAVYARTFGYDYVWDDIAQMPENPVYQAPILDGLLATQHDHMDASNRNLSGIAPAHDSYRPLLFLSHRMDVALFGFDPGVQHLHNVLLGVLAILAFYSVAAAWLALPAPALTATAVFALHPLQVESVAYVSARGDLLAGLFGLLTALCSLLFARWRVADRKLFALAWLVGACLCFLASLLCKEAYIGLPFALAGVFAARGELRPQRALLGSLLLTLLAYLAFRASIAGMGTGVSPLDGALALPGVWLTYIRMSLAPFDLSTERLYDARYAVPGWLALSLCALASFAAWRRPRWHFIRLPLSGLFWMLTLLGLSTFVVLLSGVAADRYAYLPLAGFALVMAWLLHLAPLDGAVKLLVRLVFVVLAAMWCVTTALQVPVWKNNQTLYAHAVVATPQSSMAHYRLGYAFAKESDWENAIPLLRRAIELDPANHRALNNLGVGYMNTNRLPDAERTFDEALKHSRRAHYRAWYNLGIVHFRMGRTKEGCQDLERALEINPAYRQARELQAMRCATDPAEL